MAESYSRTIRIAVVDDDPSVRDGISRLARSYGFPCEAFDSGEQLLERSLLTDVECLVLDVQLSGMDGFAVRDRLESLGLDPRIVFITAHPQANVPEWRERLKGYPCLTKPFEGEALIQAICQAAK